ncbi:hypothetical protein M422DRAFT_246156 [Sphaerobolus stellatus SS14]|nr:hypothetical protein M422DRAFT_246156 [Sphaerobolus stellatus SS14]
MACENMSLINHNNERVHLQKGQDWWTAITTWFPEKVGCLVQTIIAHERTLHPEDPIAHLSSQLLIPGNHGIYSDISYASNHESKLPMRYTDTQLSIDHMPVASTGNEHWEANPSSVGDMDYDLDDNYYYGFTPLQKPFQGVQGQASSSGASLTSTQHPDHRIGLPQQLCAHSPGKGPYKYEWPSFP